MEGGRDSEIPEAQGAGAQSRGAGGGLGASTGMWKPLFCRPQINPAKTRLGRTVDNKLANLTLKKEILPAKNICLSLDVV